MFLLVLFSLSSCEDYLDKAPESNLTVDEVFKDFDHAQGFVEEMYAMLVYKANCGGKLDFLHGDDGWMNEWWYQSRQFDNGRLSTCWATSVGFFFNGWNSANNFDTTHRPGVWDGSLMGIRKANLVIENIDKMVDATIEERSVLLGQAYFFRALFHFEIMQYWGRFPYIDKVLTDDYNLVRPDTYKETALKVDEDFQRAADLLPIDWDNEPFGQKTLGDNKGRATKGAAYAFKGKNLLVAASPLMKGTTNTYDYDKELCEEAVKAFAEVLKLDEQGVYDLVPFDRYEEVFWKVPTARSLPGSTESIFINSGGNFWAVSVNLAATLADAQYTSNSNCISPTHNFIHNNFGMANGLSIKDDLSGEHGVPTYNNSKPFEGRDPRFYKWIIIDGDKLSDKTLTGADAKHMYAQLYNGGTHRTYSGSHTGYLFKKYFPTYATKWDANRFAESTPMWIKMRLTDVYLMYAEALLAARESPVVQSGVTGLSNDLSALDVINMMRDRAWESQDVPAVPNSIVADYQKFMDELRRERSVEMCFEIHRWLDIRRWVIAHLPEQRIKTALDFDKDHTIFTESVLKDRVCEYPQHYWLPFSPDQTQMYEGFPQNPGW